MKKMIGRVLVGLFSLFFLMDAVMHIIRIKPVEEAFSKLGLSLDVAVPLGVLQIICLLVFAIPKTRMLGALFTVGYLGGAIAIHVRAQSTPFEMILPALLGLILGGGLYLIDERARQLI